MPLSEELQIVDGAEAGGWIAPRLEGGFGGRVEQMVPNGYDGYVRVFHPVFDADGSPATWAHVAETLGRVAHREMQWHRLIGLATPPGATSHGPGPGSEGEWVGSDPRTGELDEPTLAALCTVLGDHTPDPDHSFFGLSTIYGGVDESFPEAQQLRWPGRDFVVFAGPLSAAHKVGYEMSNRRTMRLVDGTWQAPPLRLWWSDQPPNLIWPADHSWFVQSEFDLDSTVVGGDRALVDALMASPDLETWEVERGDSLEVDADKIN